MNKIKYYLLPLLFLINSFALNAMETGFSTFYGTYGLTEYTVNSSEYKSFLQWGGNIYYKDSNEDNSLDYNIELDLNPLLKNRVKSGIGFNTPYLSISFGPVFGIANQSWTLIKPGFTGEIKARIPGRIFAELGGELIPYHSHLQEKDYSVYSGFYSLGFYIKRDHILCYFTQILDQYSEIEVDSYTNNKNTYLFITDFFEKNTFLKVQSKLGYEIQDQVLSNDDIIEIKTLLFGLQLDFFLNGGIDVFAGLDSRLFPLSTGSRDLSDIPEYLFTFTTGIKLYR